MSALFACAMALAMSLEGDVAFEDGLRLYKALEYEAAAPRFDEVARRAGLPAADQAIALMWLGLAHAGAGDMDIARASLKNALVVDATVQLPARVSPTIVTMFEELRKEIAQQTPVEPPPPPAPPTPPPEPSNPLLLGGGVAVGVGVLAIVGGSVLAVLAAGSLDVANDSEQFQSDAKAALDTANAEVAAAALLLPLGVALAATGGVLIGLSSAE